MKKQLASDITEDINLLIMKWKLKNALTGNDIII